MKYDLTKKFARKSINNTTLEELLEVCELIKSGSSLQELQDVYGISRTLYIGVLKNFLKSKGDVIVFKKKFLEEFSSVGFGHKDEPYTTEEDLLNNYNSLDGMLIKDFSNTTFDDLSISEQIIWNNLK